MRDAAVHPIVKRLREARLSQGYSLVKLGEISGYEGTHIWNIEAGKIRAKVEILEDLAQCLGMTIVLKERGDE